MALHPFAKQMFVQRYWQLARANRVGDVSGPNESDAVRFLLTACNQTSFPSLRRRAAEIFATFYTDHLPHCSPHGGNIA
jgi:hypothetical protein